MRQSFGLQPGDLANIFSDYAEFLQIVKQNGQGVTSRTLPKREMISPIYPSDSRYTSELDQQNPQEAAITVTVVKFVMSTEMKFEDFISTVGPGY